MARELGVALSSLQHQIAVGGATWPPKSVESLRAQWLATSNAQGPAPLADREPAPQSTEPAPLPSLAELRRQKEAYAVALKRVELQRVRGELCLRSAVALALGTSYTVIRDRLLAIPSRLRELGIAIDGAELADQVIRDALEELASSTSRIPDTAARKAQE